jgi:hypothetical protein
MNSSKCSKCGLSNFAGELQCRRCSAQLQYSTPLKKEKRPRRFSFLSLALFAALIFGGYHLYLGAKSSIEDVNADDAYRVGTQQPQKPRQTGLSRTEQDRRHATQVGNSLKDSPALQAKRKQEEETQRAIEQTSGQ